jgi:hypothetical protein
LKTIKSLVLFFLSISAAYADGTNKLFIYQVENCVISDQQSNMVVYFQGLHNNDAVLDADKPFNFGFQSTTSNYFQLFILRPEFGCKMSAKGEDGVDVELTRLGAKYGSRFGEVNGYKKDIFDMTPGYNHDVPCWDYAANPGPPRQLPAPAKLFNFRQPGHYTISIAIKCLYRPSPPLGESYRTNLFLVQFPPVKLAVIKGENK